MKKTKVLALYLPQFHEIPENDQWWGKGFTEWKGTKSAVPSYPSHYQPHVPLHDNYYNLLEKKTLKWQAHIARKAGIYGFCFYHYWFSGRKILEKPAENLLKWKDINTKFCFSWANESWKRKWSKLKGNSWNEFEAADIDQSIDSSADPENDYLLKQEYGDETEWKEHFMYLLPFFKDERYIKVNNCPIFVLYKPNDIPCLNRMLKYWNELAMAEGLSGLHVISTSVSCKSKYINAVFRYEPDFTLYHEVGSDGQSHPGKLECKIDSGLTTYSYNKIWRRILSRKEEIGSVPSYFGAFTGFDTTPRYGRRARIVHGSNPLRFYFYFKRLYRKSCKADLDLLFITAWNEWGEGAHLEPDKKYGYSYLRAIKKVLNNMSY